VLFIIVILKKLKNKKTAGKIPDGTRYIKN